MRTVFFIPALSKMSGGLANIYTVARNLRNLGRDVALMSPSPNAAGFTQAEAEGFAVLPWGSALNASDTWCVPESWPNAIPVGLNAGARVLVYVQSWVYMLDNLPMGVRWRQLPLEYLAVSRPVAWFMREVLALDAKGIVPPVIEAAFFRTGERPGSHVRVAYMPRKNRALAMQMQQVASAWLAERPGSPRPEWVEIHNKSQEEAAALLATCHLFISTGFPEGFGLPPLEGMASSCVPVGFTGFGGWEYMRQSPVCGIHAEGAAPVRPPFAFSPDGQGERDATGNGFFFSDGDTLGAGLALGRAIRRAHENSEDWRRLGRACRETAARYTLDRQAEILARLFPG